MRWTGNCPPPCTGTRGTTGTEMTSVMAGFPERAAGEADDYATRGKGLPATLARTRETAHVQSPLDPPLPRLRRADRLPRAARRQPRARRLHVVRHDPLREPAQRGGHRAGVG